MKVFLTGATGLIGSAILSRLVAGDHEVVALVRSEENAAKVKAAGAASTVGDLAEPDSYRAALTAADAVVHAGATRDATKRTVDDTFVTTAIDALDGTGKAFLYTSGVWDYGSNTNLNEEAAYAPVPMVAWRPAITERVRHRNGVRGVVIAPGMVHGHGRGLHNVLAGARTDGAAPALRVVGSGQQHWAMVHVDDLAELYLLALQSAPAGTTFIGAPGDNPTAYEICQALSRAAGLDGRVATESDQDSLDRIGPIAAALLLDQQADGARARQQLGWNPSQPTLLDSIG